MKAADVRAKTDDELRDQLRDLKKEAFNLRFQQASQMNPNPSDVIHYNLALIYILRAHHRLYNF